ncbi:MAG: solute carrier 26 family protein [Gemmatimonadales bacterium]|nr:MAG: solute carrier 26 family protein [Gemmatimonadales bacterium]
MAVPFPGARPAGYDGTDLRADVGAGVTVGVMLVPQGMAYALIAGVPPVYGLYASLVPLLVYALAGSSRQLAVGPVAIISLLVAAGVGPLADGDPARYVELTFLLALMTGAIQLGMGLLRFGFLTNFLAHPVLAGFTSAAALVIGATQLRHLLGVDVPGSAPLPEVLAALAGQLGEIHPVTFLTGAVAILLLVGLRRWKRAFPGALAVVALAIGASVLAGLEGRGVAVVGQVPGGLPMPGLPPLDPAAAWALLPAALTISLVGFMESIAVAKVYAMRHRYRVRPDRELVALGMANAVGSFFQAFPTTGGFSRTAVNDQAGSRSTVSSLVAAGVVGLVLLFLTGLFRPLPSAVLAAIVLVAVAGLVDWRGARHLWRTDRRDFGLLALTFLATLVLGIEAGIITGIVASLLALVQQSARPHMAVCGRLPGTDSYRNVERHPEAICEPGVVVLRPDAALTFANSEAVRSRIQDLVEGEAGTDGVHTLVLDFSAVNGMDSTSAHTLLDLLREMRDRGVTLRLAAVKGPVMDVLVRAGIAERMGPAARHLTVAHAADAARADDAGGDDDGGDAGWAQSRSGSGPGGSAGSPGSDETEGGEERRTASNSRRGIPSSPEEEPSLPMASGSRASSSS